MGEHGSVESTIKEGRCSKGTMVRNGRLNSSMVRGGEPEERMYEHRPYAGAEEARGGEPEERMHRPYAGAEEAGKMVGLR